MSARTLARTLLSSAGRAHWHNPVRIAIFHVKYWKYRPGLKPVRGGGGCGDESTSKMFNFDLVTGSIAFWNLRNWSTEVTKDWRRRAHRQCDSTTRSGHILPFWCHWDGIKPKWQAWDPRVVRYALAQLPALEQPGPRWPVGLSYWLATSGCT